MNTFLQRKTLIGSVLAIGLLGAMQTSAAFAGDAQVEHPRASATAHDAASKPAASRQGQPSHGEQMKQGDMDHGSMNHGSMNDRDMGHDMMSGEHNANEAGTDSNHDH